MDGVWSPSEIPVCLPGSENYHCDNFDDDYEDDSEDDGAGDIGDDGNGYYGGHDAYTDVSGTIPQ